MGANLQKAGVSTHVPRKSSLLPYLTLNGAGNLVYKRRIPPDLREVCGGKSLFTRSLGVSSTDPKDPAVISAWSQVNAEAEALLTAAKSKSTGDKPALRNVTPVSRRQAAGIGAEPWRFLQDAGDNGSHTPDIERMLVDVTIKALAAQFTLQNQGDIQEAHAIRENIAETLLAPVLDQLGITPDPADKAEIHKRLWGYLQDVKTDLIKRQEGDFNSSSLQDKAPALPKKQVTYEELLEQFELSAGGTVERDGVGITEKRMRAYRHIVGELQRITAKSFPNELTIKDARRFLNEIQQSKLSARSKSERITLARMLFKNALQVGLVEINPFESILFRTAKGTKQQTYRSFTKQELKSIYKYIHDTQDTERCFVFDSLLCTGARQGEIIHLRRGDIKTTDSGVVYFEFTHEPTAEYPTKLKSGSTGERLMPWHKLLIENRYLDYIREQSEGYIIRRSKANYTWTTWFKNILIKLGIYTKGETGLHSLRNSAIDMWREAGISAEFRRAFVAHASKDVQDKVYGKGLKRMPDVLAKELLKLDLSWLE